MQRGSRTWNSSCEAAALTTAPLCHTLALNVTRAATSS
uniref:Uncharacterized protein n=1 Tax=Anguilla anguilla TaxID=7936 RepID=A0A0E9UM23_ANGAN